MKNIVVGIDFSERSRQALAEALRLGASAGGMVHAVHVVERTAVDDLHLSSPGESQEQLEGRLLLDTKRLLEAHIDEAGIDREVTRLTVEVLAGRPSDDIVQAAQRVGADLIVLARNSASDPKRGAGSTAVQVLRHAPSNVLLVREDHSGPYRKIIACVDFSEHSRRAIRGAAAFAEIDPATPAELHLAHAYQPYWDVIHLGAVPMDATGELQEQHRKSLEDRLAKLAGATRELIGGREVGWHIVPAGSAASALVEFLENAQADLAVVASHGRTGLARVLIGSTAERIVRDASCSVLTIKSRPER